jgi:hypothetical protein
VRRNPSSESSTIVLDETRSRGALIGSFLLLAASFALLVLAPVLLARFQSASQTVPASSFLPIAAASGIALGGGAAMIAVVARLVRDIELRPYAGLAPVLAVFAGFVLWGLRAELPLAGVPTEYAGVFALMVSVAGGALIAQRAARTRVVGWAIAFFAPAVLLLLAWSGSGKAQLGDAIVSLSPPLKMFLGMSAASALVMAVLGEASRVFARNAVAGEPRLSYPKDTQSFGYGRASEEPRFLSLSAAQRNAGAEQRSAAPLTSGYEKVLPTPKYGAVAPTSNYDAASYDAADYGDVYTPDESSRVNVWELEDEQLTIPKRFAWWKVLLLVLLVGGGAAAATYYGMILPNRAKEQAAAEVLKEKQAQIAAESQREADLKRAIESKAAAARLEAMLAGPAAAAPTGAEGQTPEPAQAAPAARANVPAAAANVATQRAPTIAP